jgi:hypothetical protein
MKKLALLTLALIQVLGLASQAKTFIIKGGPTPKVILTMKKDSNPESLVNYRVTFSAPGIPDSRINQFIKVIQTDLQVILPRAIIFAVAIIELNSEVIDKKSVTLFEIKMGDKDSKMGSSQASLVFSDLADVLRNRIKDSTVTEVEDDLSGKITF